MEASHDELMEEVAAALSHDLGAPLRQIRFFGERLQTSLSGSLRGDEARHFEFVTGGARRASSLLEGAVQFLRLKPKYEGSLKGPVALNTCVENALAGAAGLAEAAGAEVTRVDLPSVNGSRAQLEFVFAELVGNALKFRHADRAPRLVFGLETGEEWVKITLHDNGIGIYPNKLEAVLRLGKRAVAHTEYPGVGVGLALCRRIAELHGGCLSLKCNQEFGTSVTLDLPVANPLPSEGTD